MSIAYAVAAKGEKDVSSYGSISDLNILIDDDVEGVAPAASSSLGGIPKHDPAAKKRPAVNIAADQGEPAFKKVKDEPCDETDAPPGGPFSTPRKNKAPSSSGGSACHSEGGAPSVGVSKKASEGCCGCGRIAGVSPDFLIVGETCAWAFQNGRGQWCRECHRVHQHNWQQTHSLTYFPQWLSEPKNRIQWEETLLADLSLRWEGVGKVTGDMVAKRVNVFKWLWNVIGSDPIHSAGTEGFIRQWLAKLSGVAPVAAAVQIKTEVGVSPGQKKSVLAKELDGLIPKAKELMDALAADTWISQVSDGNFTKHCEKLAGCYAKCGAVGESPIVTDMASTWSEGTQAAKQFLKAFSLVVHSLWNMIELWGVLQLRCVM